jgi:hypothetical protein
MKKLLLILSLMLCVSVSGQTIGKYSGDTSPLVYKDGAGGHASLVAMQKRGWVPVGYARYSPASATTLGTACLGTGCVTLPATAKHAIITIKSYPLAWRDDGTAPTATEGLEFPAGVTIVVEDSRAWLQAVQFIATAAGTPDVRISYYKSAGE